MIPLKFVLGLCWLISGLVPAVSAGPLSGITVVLDAGHGGFDYGTRRRFSGRLITEAQLTWGVVTELKPMLEAEGARVVLTTRRLKGGTELPTTFVFGQDTIPASGGDIFWTDGQPPIRGDRFSLEQRLQIARHEAERDTNATVLFLSVHFDHVMSDGCPAGARVIYPAGFYDTLLVGSVVTALDSAGLLRSADHRPAIANGRSGLGRYLLLLRQESDPRRVREKRLTRLIYNHVFSTVMVELANLPNNSDWRRLQAPGVLRRYAQVLNHALLEYALCREQLAP